MLSASATPTQKAFPPQQPASIASTAGGRPSIEREGRNGLQPPSLAVGGQRNLSASVVTFAPRGSSLNPNVGPGSFSSELRSQIATPRAPSRAEVYLRDAMEEDGIAVAEKTLNALRDLLSKEMKI